MAPSTHKTEEPSLDRGWLTSAHGAPRKMGFTIGLGLVPILKVVGVTWQSSSVLLCLPCQLVCPFMDGQSNCQSGRSCPRSFSVLSLHVSRHRFVQQSAGGRLLTFLWMAQPLGLRNLNWGTQHGPLRSRNTAARSSAGRSCRWVDTNSVSSRAYCSGGGSTMGKGTQFERSNLARLPCSQRWKGFSDCNGVCRSKSTVPILTCGWRCRNSWRSARQDRCDWSRRFLTEMLPRQLIPWKPGFTGTISWWTKRPRRLIPDARHRFGWHTRVWLMHHFFTGSCIWQFCRFIWKQLERQSRIRL